MHIKRDNVMKAFKVYTALARDGMVGKAELGDYDGEDEVRSLLEEFADGVDCAIVRTADGLYLIPETSLSPFHVSNDWLKRTYLRADSLNADIYLVYFATIVLFGAFFDRYHSQEQTLQFITDAEWLKRIDERVRVLESLDTEKLIQSEREFSYNWRLIIEKWRDMDDIKESAKRQSGNTISRLSFLDRVKRFLISEGLVKEIGNAELTITEKAKVIIQRFFMNAEFNNNILEFIYDTDDEEGVADADD